MKTKKSFSKEALSFPTIILFICLMCLFVAGCSKDGTDAGQETDSESVLTDGGAGSADADGDAGQTQAPEETPDVDLTALSSTMVYAEVFNMIAEPEGYMGKTIRMRGPYAPQWFEGTKKYYHYVVVQDATACCKNGLEFIWNGDHSYPEDYPEIETEVEVTGIFKSYEEGGQPYYYLEVDEIEIL